MSSALDEFERSLVAASRALHAEQTEPRPETARAERGQQPRRRTTRWFRQRRLLVSFVALVAAVGGVAAASTLLWPSERLAEGRVNCFMATHGTGALDVHTLAVGGARPNGQPPIGFCRRWYRLNRYRLNGSESGPLVARLPLIACQQNATTVGVYVATGQPDQCQRLGAQPLPPTYAGAGARLRDLQASLRTLEHQGDCLTPAILADRARALLRSRGFSGWHVNTPPPDPWKGWLFGYPLPTRTGGTCGTFGRGNPPGNAIDIDTQRRTITVSVGPPLSIARRLNHIYYELDTTTYEHCFTATSVRTLVRAAFAGTPLRPRFATVARQPGVIFEPKSERLYQAGCVRVNAAIPGNNNRFIDVVLEARGAPALPAAHVFPPAGAFHQR